MKLILSFLSLCSIVFSSQNIKVLASCSNAQVELVDLEKCTTTGYGKDSLHLTLLIRDKKVYVKSEMGESKLIFLGGNNPQFLEHVISGHNVLYTYFPRKKILTIQKSYDLFGPIMVNIYLKCK